MDKKYNKWQSFLLNIIYIAIIFVSVNLISNVLEIKINLLNQLFIVMIISIIVKYFVKHPIFFILSLIIGFVALLAVEKYRMPIFLPLGGRVSSVFSNIIGNLQGRESILDENKTLVFYTITSFLSIYTAIAIYRFKKISLLLPPYIFIFLSYWYTFIDRAYTANLIFLILFLILLAFKGYNSSKFKNNDIFNRWIRTSIIYSIIIISLASLIPKNNDFINWPWLQTKVYEKFPAVEDLRHYKDYNRETSNAELFSFSTSGFSEVESELGGPLVQSDKKVMTVESDNEIYLRGKVKHFYTGRKWKSQSTETKEYNIKENFNLPSQSEREISYTQESIIVNFDSFKSNTIFTPYKPIGINSNKISEFSVDEDDIISSKYGLYKDEGYLVSFIKPLAYETLRDKQVNRIKTDLQDLNFYLQIPDDTITDRTKELTSSLVEDTDNDYEKAIKIQKHLRDNYKYELDTRLLPKDEEFIDHFLFQEQEGYCTYYASSMAIMLRLEGIPTRYIEGYIVNEKIDENNYQVRQKHAHTWIEAFIEPAGWMIFEPTAAYEPIDNIIPAEEKPDEEFKEDIIPEKDNIENKPIGDPDIPLEDTNEDIGMEEESKNLSNNMILSLVSIILLSILIRIFTRHLKYKKKQRKLIDLNNREKIIYLYKDIIDVLSILDYPIKAGETHFEYADRIGYKFTDLKDYGIKDITNIFVKLKYSNKKTTDDDVYALLEYRMILNKRLKNTLGSIKYFYRKYINIFFKKRTEIP